MCVKYWNIKLPVILHTITVTAIAPRFPHCCGIPQRDTQLIIAGDVPDGVEGGGKDPRICYLIDPSEHVKAVVVLTDV